MVERPSWGKNHAQNRRMPGQPGGKKEDEFAGLSRWLAVYALRTEWGRGQTRTESRRTRSNSLSQLIPGNGGGLLVLEKMPGEQVGLHESGPAGSAFEPDSHGINGEGAEEIAAHALLGGDKSAGSLVKPVDIEAAGHALKLGGHVEVADELRGAGGDEKQIFDEAAEGAEEIDGFLLTVCAAAVGFRGVEELGVVRFPQCAVEDDEGVLAAGDKGIEIEGEGAADGAFGEAGDQGAVG
jgi:hypothetical protein